MDHATPPQDAYGRVTDPGRYRILHEAVDPLVAGLVRDYEVSGSVVGEDDVDPLGRLEASRAVRFREELRGRLQPWRVAEFVGPDDDWRRSSRGRIDLADLQRLGGQDRRDWRPWPARITPSGER